MLSKELSIHLKDFFNIFSHTLFFNFWLIWREETFPLYFLIFFSSVLFVSCPPFSVNKPPPSDLHPCLTPFLCASWQIHGLENDFILGLGIDLVLPPPKAWPWPPQNPRVLVLTWTQPFKVLVVTRTIGNIGNLVLITTRWFSQLRVQQVTPTQQGCSQYQL